MKIQKNLKNTPILGFIELGLCLDEIQIQNTDIVCFIFGRIRTLIELGGLNFYRKSTVSCFVLFHKDDSKMSESIAAVTGSFDKDGCFYGARLYAQKSPKGQAYEMIHDLDKMVYSLLGEYYRINKIFPKKIVFFRDGVSEGQFPLVMRHEMNKIREACQKVNAAYKPAVTFVVVQKRHHTRLFPVDPRDKNGRAENVPPGTLVDRDIVTKGLFDFFLCSHVGIQVVNLY